MRYDNAHLKATGSNALRGMSKVITETPKVSE